MLWQLLWQPFQEITPFSRATISVDGLWRIFHLSEATLTVGGAPYEVYRLNNKGDWFFMGRSPTWENALANIHVDAQYDLCEICWGFLDPEIREESHQRHIRRMCGPNCPGGGPVVKTVAKSKYWNRRRTRA